MIFRKNSNIPIKTDDSSGWSLAEKNAVIVSRKLGACLSSQRAKLDVCGGENRPMAFDIGGLLLLLQLLRISEKVRQGAIFPTKTHGNHRDPR